jgi:gliding motility-associated lipoprotein GldD
LVTGPRLISRLFLFWVIANIFSQIQLIVFLFDLCPSTMSPLSKYYPLSFLFLVLFLSSCDEETYAPRPRGFFRITLPEKSYIKYTAQDCPFAFEIPTYAKVSKDSSKTMEPCFLNIDFAPFNATVYLTYKQVHNDLAKLLEDHRSMTMKHIPKASGIDEQAYNNPVGHVYGSYYYVKGSSASNVQFYLTDSTTNFIRGSLYFNNAPQPDSIAPVLDFIGKDVIHIVETFHWN